MFIEINGATIDLTKTVAIDPITGRLTPCAIEKQRCIGVAITDEAAEALQHGARYGARGSIEVDIAQYPDADGTPVSVIRAMTFSRKMPWIIGKDEWESLGVVE